MQNSKAPYFEIIFLGTDRTDQNQSSNLNSKISSMLHVSETEAEQIISSAPATLLKSSDRNELERLANELHTVGAKTQIVFTRVTNIKAGEPENISLNENNDLTELTKEFERAIGLFQKGDHQSARSIFIDLSLRHPLVPEIHFNLGGTFSALREWELAITSYKEALRLFPDYHQAYLGLGNVYNLISQFDLALECFSKCKTLETIKAQALFGEGVAFHGKKEFQVAFDLFQAALFVKKDYKEALFNSADCQRRLGKFEAAENYYRECNKLFPDYFEAYYWLGKLLHEKEEQDAAVVVIQKAYSLNQHHLPTVLELSICYLELNRNDEAKEILLRAYQLHKKNIDLAVLLACSERKLKNYREAKTILENVLAINPNSESAYFELGEIAFAQAEHDKAIEYYQKILKQMPRATAAFCKIAEVYVAKEEYVLAENTLKKCLSLDASCYQAALDLAFLYGKLDRREDSRKCFELALEIKPGDKTVITNLGNLKFDEREPNQGVHLYNSIIKNEEETNIVHWNRALLRLLNGNFAEGWKDFEARLKALKIERRYNQPYWDGSPLKGKTIFVYLEQGLGDCIMMARYLSVLVAQGAKVVVEGNKALKRLLCTIPHIEVITSKEHFPEFDFHCSIMSFPALLKTEITSIPSAFPYFFLPDNVQKKWERIGLSEWKRPRIGFVYSGASYQSNNRHRSCSLIDMLPLFESPDISWVCLQKEISEDDRNIFSKFPHIKLIDDQVDDLWDTATLIDELDLVISVDTSIAHLTGAIKKPVWILLCQNSSWQWLLERKDSPWYPSARLFRQENLDVWPPVIKEVRAAIKKEFSKIRFEEDFDVEEKAKLALQYLEIGHLNAARNAALQILQLKESDSKAYYVLAECCRLERRFDLALHLLQRSLDLNPDEIESQLALNHIYQECGEYKLAEASARHLAIIDPNRLDVQQNLIGTLIKCEKSSEALIVGAEAIRQFPENAELKFLTAQAAIEMNQYELAENLLHSALSIQDAQPELHLVLSKLNILKKNYKVALTLAEEALEINNYSADILNEAAEIAFLANQPKLALDRYNQALAFDKRSLVALVESGNILLSEKENELALERFLVALLIQPNDFNLHLKTSEAFQACGKIAEAKESLLHAAYLSPKSELITEKLKALEGVLESGHAK